MLCRTEYDLKVIGRNLRRLRMKNHMTVEQVREYLCMGSVQAIYKYEAGMGYPQADTLLALMELYNVGVNDIVKEYKEEQDSSFCLDFFIHRLLWQKGLCENTRVVIMNSRSFMER